MGNCISLWSAKMIHNYHLKVNMQQKNDNNKWITSIKRIELLYPGKHSIDVYSENGTTNLLLILEMVETAPSIEKQKEEFVLS